MRILILGNSLTFANDLPGMLAKLTGAQVVHHTRGGARLSEQLNPKTRLGAQTQAALSREHWDYVVLQEMSHGPFSSPDRFFASVEQLCAQIRAAGAVPVLYATWAYRKDCPKLAETCRTAARKNNALLADVGQRFYQLADTLNLYAADGVHPSEAGSRLAAETIAAAIQTHKENES